MLADLAVDFIELQHDLALVHLPLPLGLQPRPQALQVDRSLCTSALAWGDERVRLAVFSSFCRVLEVLGFSAPADLAHGLLRLLSKLRGASAALVVVFFREHHLVAIGINEYRMLLLLVLEDLFSHRFLLVEQATSCDCRGLALCFFQQLNLVNVNDAIEVLSLLLIIWSTNSSLASPPIFEL